MTEDSSTLLPKTPLRHLNTILKQSTVDVEFQDINYFVKEIGFKNGTKQILHSVNGKFLCGEFSAILGPSGAGKSTLLNILAGYVTRGVEGRIKINGDCGNLSVFANISSYIMFENIAHSYLSVREIILYAVRLKLGVRYKDKVAIAEEVIQFLGLGQCLDTRAELLSGGEKKRLTIAVELVCNPSVLLLDEPTTGLDEFAVKQCTDLLKKISQLNRTVICTIQQPSSRILHCFDHVYILADGRCVYNGTPTHLVPFLCHVGHPCPSNYNPADHVIELVYSNSAAVDNLRAIIQDGKVSLRDEDRSATEAALQESEQNFAISFLDQVCILLSRMFWKLARNKTGLVLQLFAHILVGLVMGSLFNGVGQDASRTFAILMICQCSSSFLSFTYSWVANLLFPEEVQLLKREYFNRWFRLRAYCLALVLIDTFFLVAFGTIFVVILYFLTDQPLDVDRFVGFYLINLMIGLISQTMGHVICTVFGGVAGVAANFVVLTCMTNMSMYGLGYKVDFTPLTKFLMSLSYIRLGSYGMCRALAYKRKPLVCKEDYCHYVRLEKMFTDTNVPMYHWSYDLGYLCVFFVLFQVGGYLALKWKLDRHLVAKLKNQFRRNCPNVNVNFE